MTTALTTVRGCFLRRSSSALAILLALLCGRALAASCTDGVDCYEDCRRNTDGAGNDVGSYANTACQTAGIIKATISNLVVIEDFENPDYYANQTATSDSWVDTGGTSGYRGLGSAWMDKYIGANDNCSWRAGEPAAPVSVGEQCSPSTCGVIEYTPDNNWGDHEELDSVCIDIQASGDVDAEGYGLTLNPNYYGTHWMAGRVPAGSCSGSVANDISFSGGASTYFVAVMAYSSNLVDSDVHTGTGCPTSPGDDFVPRPWKHFEFGDTNHFGFGGYPVFAFMGAAVGTDAYAGDAPFSGFYTRVHGASNASCQTAVDAAVSVGDATCHDDAGDADFIYWGPTTAFDRSTDWPLGTWALVRGEMLGLGTASCDFHVWFWQEGDESETQIFAWDDFDCSTYVAETDLSPLKINWFYNGGAPGCETTGPCTTTEPISVYYDFWEIGTGAAPSAADIGWETALGAGGGSPSTPSNGSPSGQFTIGERVDDAQRILLAAPW